MSRKEDPRTIRTRHALKQAVITLLQEGESLNQLTVQKVAKKAGLNRTTFYLHYQDIPDLLAQTTNDVLQELSQIIDVLIQSANISEKTELAELLDYLYEQRKYLLVLFQVEQFEQHLQQDLTRLINARRARVDKLSTRGKVEATIKAASLVGILMWWLRDGLHHSSEFMVEHITLMYRG